MTLTPVKVTVAGTSLLMISAVALMLTAVWKLPYISLLQAGHTSNGLTTVAVPLFISYLSYGICNYKHWMG